uniref:SOCS box domain-containing protein n=1 Tax=Glossina brevipalpis TaxID=37001 RepID=A0A1A9WK73_9MUSC
MYSYTSTYDLNERLLNAVHSGNYDHTLSCLMQGAKASNISLTCGRTALGTAALIGDVELLELLIQSCEEPDLDIFRENRPNSSEIELDITPDGMDCLEWEDEFVADSDTDSLNGNDEHMKEEFTSLYYYYAKTFEITGSIVSRIESYFGGRASGKKQDPHTIDTRSMTPLHYAAACGHSECVRLLLEHGADANKIDSKGCTPLHVGSEYNEVTRLLLKFGANVNSKTFHMGDTPLHLALRTRCPMSAKIMLQSELIQINETNDNAETYLMCAIANEQYDIAMELIQRGARLNLQDKEGYTALYYAVVQNNISLTTSLLEHGARRITPHYLLHYCIANNMPEMLKLLLNRDTHLNSLFVRNQDGFEPISLAIVTHNYEMLQHMLNLAWIRGPSVLNLLRLTDNFLLAIQSAENIKNFINIARILLAYSDGTILRPPKSKHSINVLCCESNCNSALTKALTLNKLDIAEFLLKEGADLKQICHSAVNYLRNSLPMGCKEFFKLTIYMGFQYPFYKSLNTSSPDWTNTRCELEHELRFLCTRPLSLQMLTRNCIRWKLLHKFHHLTNSTVEFSCQQYRATITKSSLQQMIEQLEIPKCLQTYLIDFNDCDSIMRQKQM